MKLRDMFDSDMGTCTHLRPGDRVTNGQRVGEVIEVTPSPYPLESDLYVYVGSPGSLNWADYWLLEDVSYEVRQ